MEGIDKISEFFQGLILAGTAFVIVRCGISIAVSGDENSAYKRKIKHAIIFLVLAQLVFELKNLLLKYF